MIREPAPASLSASAFASGRLVKGNAVAIIAVHAAGAVLMLNLLPRGFPISHPRFLANEVAPILLLAISAGTGAALARGRALAIALLAAFPAAWLGAATSAMVSFPITGRSVASVALAGGLYLAALWVLLARSYRPPWAASTIAVALGLSFGWALVRSQRASGSFTRPHALVPISPEASAERELPAGVQVDGARVAVQSGTLELSVFPLLEFHSRSPDRFWTLFSRLPSEDGALPDPSTHLQVASRAGAELGIHATRDLPNDVFSHLNSFTTLTLRGHEKLGVSFSPCPSAVVDFVHAEYPSGAPARFAYLDEASTFRVAQASSAEKGPFTVLAQGHLRRGEPLSIRLLELADGAPRPLFDIEFADWSDELSTALSPTAGFGVPENAIQFGLASAITTSEAYVILNLAGTSIGRGFDSVGHAAGRYENRITVRTVASALRR